MAHYQMANEKESQRWYDYGVMLHEADGPCSSEIPARLINVEEWIQASVLHQQAKTLIEGTTTKTE